MSLIATLSCSKDSLFCDFSGKSATQTFQLKNFDKVEINQSIELILIDGSENKMEITADKNVLKKIEYHIDSGKLIINNQMNCIRENPNAIATIKLTVDEIDEIIANTNKTVKSENQLHFNRFKIICENNSVGSNNIADFDLDLDCNRVSIVSNGSSLFKIKGQTNHLFVGFYAGSAILEGKELHANHINIMHRGAADMHLYPIQDIRGKLFGYGNVYLYHRPPIINVDVYPGGNLYIVN